MGHCGSFKPWACLLSSGVETGNSQAPPARPQAKLTSCSQPNSSSSKGTKGFGQPLGPCRPVLPCSSRGGLPRLQHPASHWRRDWVGQGSCSTGFSGTPQAPSAPDLTFQKVKPNQALLPSSSQLSQYSDPDRPVQISAGLLPSQSISRLDARGFKLRFYHSQRWLAMRRVLGKDPLWMALSGCSVLGTRVLQS